MDPDATLAALMNALRDRDWDHVGETAIALLRWMERGGFPPVTVGPKELGNEWHRSVTTFICYAATSKVAEVRRRRSRKKQ